MDADLDVKWTETGEIKKKTQVKVAGGRNLSFSNFFFCLNTNLDGGLVIADPSGPDQFHVVTVQDTGRNWSDEEVRALVEVWSDERVCKQLENSTRKRDIFVHISSRLMQQGIERDWKQCHTKYKNLKYLYRSLQKGKYEETDPRRLMRFYDEVDAIMNRASRQDWRPRRTECSQVEVNELATPEDREERNLAEMVLQKMSTCSRAATGERSPSSCSASSVSLETRLSNEEQTLPSGLERRSDQRQKLQSEWIVFILIINEVILNT